MKRRRPTIEDFTIGWICALPVELSAAISVLDEEYEDSAEAAHCVLGRIGSHNVVIACLPAGQYGTNSALNTATQVRSIFTEVQYWLMVGVGGGVPSSGVDVRLGDVVIARPQGQHGGVIQYDLGKSGPDGHRIRTGLLNAPPAVLGTAVSKLQSILPSRKVKIQSYLDSLSYLDEPRRHTTEPDILFQPEYQHVHGESCEGCSHDELVPRASRSCKDVIVHFGAIASGNQVIRDGVQRDKLSVELGGVLCFEMEAAGLMNHFPCLVVRGICDYADSHKNKKWQSFAAASAAVCARELLSCIPARIARRTQHQRSISPSMPSSTQGGSTSAPIQHGGVQPSDVTDSTHTPGLDSNFVQMSLTVDQRTEYLESLPFDDINTRQATIRSAHSRTCRWILDCPEYKSWLNDQNLPEHHGFFWIKGNPGTGKSTLLKFVFTSTSRQFPQATTLSFFFNARGNLLERSTLGMYQSILLQLLTKFPALQDVFALCPPSVSIHGRIVWEIERLKTVFEHAVLRLKNRRLLVFVDALDECDEDEVRDMVSFLENLGRMASGNGVDFRTCFSSRHYPHVTIDDSIELILERRNDHQQDIANFLSTELKVGRGNMVDKVKAEILARASGIFLWVVLVVQILNKEYARGNKHTMQNRLKEIPDGLDRLFEDLLTRDNHNTESMVLCLQWVLFARQPLKVEQLYYAILAGSDPDSLSAWDPAEISSDDMWIFVLNNSKGLVEETKGRSRTLQFIHESVRDFFLKGNGLSKLTNGSYELFRAQSHDKLTQCCLSYFARLDILGLLGVSEPLPEVYSDDAAYLCQQSGEKFPFLQYAIHHALHHSDTAHYLGVTQDSYLQNFPLRYWNILNNLLAMKKEFQHSSEVSMLYILAEEDLPSLIKIEFERTGTMDIKGERRGFPLLAAKSRGNILALQALLRCQLGDRTDFSTSMVDDIISYLLKDRTRVRSTDDTLLSWISRVPCFPLFQLFVHDVQRLSEFVAGHGPILLYQACRYASHETVTQLLLHCVDPYFRNHGRSPGFFGAIEAGRIEIVRLLLDHGAESDSKSISKQFALSRATEFGHTEIVKLLLQHGAELNLNDQFGRSALSYAAEAGHTEIVELLLQHGAELNLNDQFGRSSLSYAAGAGHTEIISLLLMHGAELDSIDKDSRTVLSYATGAGHIQMVKFLLQQGLGSDAEGIFDRLALVYAVKAGHTEIVKLLLRCGAMPDPEVTFHRLVFLYAVGAGYVGIVELLLQHGVGPNSKDMFDRSALSYAAGAGHIEVVQLLIKHGADPGSVDSDVLQSLLNAGDRKDVQTTEMLKQHDSTMSRLEDQTYETLSVQGGRNSMDNPFVVDTDDELSDQNHDRE